MNHGGKREGSGKPRTLIDERRLMVLIDQKVTMRDIGRRLGVSEWVIQRAVKRNKLTAE